MCGIVYRKSFNGSQVARQIRRQYFKQKDRGDDGFGFIAIEKGKVVLRKSLFEHEIMRELKQHRCDEIMFHHRWPTSTKNSIQTNHPIATTHRKYKHNYYIIHNGIIMNDMQLNMEHYNLGIKYETKGKDKMFNDSECLLHELALIIEGIKPKESFNAQGSLAFILLQTDKKTNKAKALYFGRNWESPLQLDYKENKFLSLSSEGSGQSIEPNILYKYDYKTATLCVDNMDIPFTSVSKYTSIDDDSMVIDIDDELEPQEIESLGEETLQAHYYEKTGERMALVEELARAQREEDYDTESEIQEDINELEDYLNMLEREIDKRAFLLGIK